MQHRVLWRFERLLHVTISIPICIYRINTSQVFLLRCQSFFIFYFYFHFFFINPSFCFQGTINLWNVVCRFQSMAIHVCARIFFFFFLFCSVFSTSCYRWFVLYFIKSVSRPLVNGSRIVLILFQSVVVHDIYPPRYICRDYFEAWPFISSRLVSLRCSTFDWIAGQERRRGRSTQLFLNCPI